MNTTIKTGSFRTHLNQDGTLHAARLGCVLESGSEFPEFFSGFLGSFVGASNSFVAIAHMLFRGDPFKICSAVIGFVVVLVMDKLGIVGVRNPAESDNSVHQSPSTKREIAVASFSWETRSHLSKNLPATRHGVEMVEESVFDSAYFKARHVGPLWVSSSKGILL